MTKWATVGFGLWLVACGGGRGMAREPTAAASGTPDARAELARESTPLAKMSGTIKHFEKGKDHLRVDKVGAKDGELEPDGVPDAVFEVDIDGPADAVFLISTDERGESNGELAADTLAGKDPLPAEVAGLGALGKHTAGIGVIEKGKLLSATDGHLPPLAPGPHALALHLSTRDLPKQGAFRVFVRFTDGTLVKGPIQSIR